MTAPDISNIESKPTVVLVSNQSEFDQLMHHLEKEGYVWNGYSAEKPTEWRPSSFLPPYIVNIRPDKKITWGRESNETAIPFPEYAAKHIQPTRNTGKFKRDRKRVEKHKYDAVVFDLKMAQTALDNRNKEIDGWVKQNNELRAERDRLEREIKEVADIGLKWNTKAEQLTAERDRLREAMELHKQSSMRKSLEIDRLQAENAELRKDNDIWRKAGRETEQQKEKALALIELQGIEIEQSNNSWEIIISAYNSLSKELDEAKDERDRLKAELNDLIYKSTLPKAPEYRPSESGIREWKDLYIKADERALKAAEKHAHLDTLSRKLRDQRDTARFLAALFFLVCAGFAVAVWIGKLLPVY